MSCSGVATVCVAKMKTLETLVFKVDPASPQLNDLEQNQILSMNVTWEILNSFIH